MERKNLFKLSKYFNEATITAVAETALPPSKPEIAAAAEVPAIDTAGHCVTCKVSFATNDTKLAHYKTDWHRFNLKLRMAGLKRITEKEFAKVNQRAVAQAQSSPDAPTPSTDNNLLDSSEEGESDTYSDDEERKDSASSASPSFLPDDEDDVNSKVVRNASPKISFLTTTVPPSPSAHSLPVTPFGSSDSIPRPNDGSVKYNISLWKTVLLPRSHNNEVGAYLSALKDSPKKDQWSIFLCTGGYFAGAVFKQREVLQHKRIARYTTRRKQGGSQTTRDNQGGNIRSAGAHIRRTNEVKLREEIAEILKEWKQLIADSSMIFLFAPSFNRHSFFYEGSPIQSSDPRVRGIPFTTKRPTFIELKRINELLSTVEVTVARDEQPTPSPAPTPEAPAVPPSPVMRVKLSAPAIAREEDQLLTATAANDLTKATELLEKGYARPPPALDAPDFETPLLAAFEKGNLDLFKLLLQWKQDLDVRIPKNSFETVLCTACKQNKAQEVELLLTHGADPTIKEIHELSPWDLTTDANLRTFLRKFAGLNPDKWNWYLAKIPPLTKEMEDAQKKKQAEKRKKKKQVTKEKKKVEAEQAAATKVAEALQAQQEEQLRSKRAVEDAAARDRMQKMAGMSDREKRAAAAEQRLKSVAAGPRICDSCGASLSALVPFERLGYKYCSTKCVSAHKTVLDKK